MAVTFVLGRAGSGKTWLCLRSIADRLADATDERRLVLLVPEQASFEMERALACMAPDGGTFRAETLSFSRLAQRVLQTSAHEPLTLTARARAMALRRILAQDEAPHEFGPASGARGFIRGLDRLIRELLSEGVSPDTLENAGEACDEPFTATRTRGLARIYRRYLEWLGPRRIDPAQRLAALRERLAATEWLREASIWVDGFASFTREEFATLISLARQSREMTLTLLMDTAAPSSSEENTGRLFAATERVYGRLLAEFRAAGVRVTEPKRLPDSAAPPRFADAPGLVALEQSFASDTTDTLPASRDPSLPEENDTYAGVRLLAFANVREELRAAAGEIRRRVLESDGAVRFRDFAVIARNLTPLVGVVSEVFEEFEIPHFLDQRRPLASHALRYFVRDIFELLLTDFSLPAGLSFLRGGLAPFRQGDCEHLQNLLTRHEIRGLQEWRNIGSRLLAPADRTPPDIVRALSHLLRLREQGSASGAAWAKALYAALRAMRVPRRIVSWIRQAQRTNDWEGAALHAEAWQSLCDVLDEMSEALGAAPLSLREAAETLDEALRETTLGLAPPTRDQTLVSSIERSRHPEVRFAWLIGFNEGVFPARPTEDLLLSDAQRGALRQAGLDGLRDTATQLFDERMLAYIALTRASQALTISYSLADEAGEEMLPSPFVLDLPAALRKPARQPVTPSSCLVDFARRTLEEPGSPRILTLRKSIEREPALAPRLADLLRGERYTNEPDPLRIALCLGNPQEMSVSAFSRYLNCPFQYFVGDALRIAQFPGATPLPVRLGGHAHAILHRVTQRALERSASPQRLEDDEWLTLLEEERSRQWEELARDGAGEREACLWSAQGNRLKELLLAHVARWRQGECRPLAVEYGFGAGEPLPPLELTAANGHVFHVRGRIDRIDACRMKEGDWLIVYDYKTTAVRIGDVSASRERLQLLVYMLAVDAAAKHLGALGARAIFSAPLYPDLSMLEKGYFADASERQKGMFLLRPRGLFDEALIPGLDAAPDGESPVAVMMGRYKDARPTNVMAQRLQHARDELQTAVDGLAENRVDILPLMDDKKLACDRCPFKSACRFEIRLNRIRRTAATAKTSEGEE